MNNARENKSDAVRLEAICQIALTVQDLARSKDFYQNKLGLKFLFEAGTMAFFQCGSVRLMLGLGGRPVPAADTILYFTVKDIQGTHATLKDQGIGFLAAPHVVAKMPEHDLWLALLRDPDGNTLGLMSEVSRASQESA